jgi:pyruvate formate lyase activating enzyme
VRFCKIFSFLLTVLFFSLVICVSSLNFTKHENLCKLFADPGLKEALFYETSGDSLRCLLCPRKCLIKPGRRGFCGVRENSKGVLYTLVYGKPVSLNVDPVEKKPFFHFYPGSPVFSLATAGCNLRCKFCQNWQISQSLPEELAYTYLEPKEVVEKIKQAGCSMVAYTYSEPVIFYEYMLEIAKLSRQQGIKNVMHSNGYINEEPLRFLADHLDAANIDLKGFSDQYYQKLSEGTLAPVLSSLLILKEKGVHIEITNLLLPGFNDDQASIRQMCLWIKENLGAETPLHFGRFYPMFKLTGLNPTPVETLEKARGIALSCGLKYVYIGNVAGHAGENTLCPGCGKTLVKRTGYFIEENNIVDGKCGFCGEKIEGVW